MKISKTKLREDQECGEGEVVFDQAFLDADWLYRADVLKDWIYDLQKEYDRALDDSAAEHAKAIPQVAAAFIEAVERWNLRNKRR